MLPPAETLPRLRLPAPPAKRHKPLAAQRPAHEQQQTEQAPPPEQAVVAAAPPLPPAGEADAFEAAAAELDCDADELPNDTLAALQLLKSRFPPEARVLPFATRAQLYSLLSDRTTADRQLEELRRRNAVRLLQLPTSGRGDEQHAIMLTSDYEAALRGCQQDLAGSATNGGGGGSGPSPAIVFEWFARRVLPVCTDTMVTHGDLVALLSGARVGAGSARSSGPAAAAAARATGAGGGGVTEAHVSLLLNRGFLTRHTASADSYLFSMPSAGAAVRSVAAGRQEILSLLQRRRHPEVLESELEKKKLQRSVLGVRWHVADMAGGGVLLRLPTAVGPLLRVAKRGG
ncbi:Serine threonine-kinase 19 [Micractinium conductrix]|uniref:Serine threonine-kinase 19 n=1 Tax=Micractinium conductrix TaxID=554055 RepID=A0A2P6UZX6_9CHLO|nr:Serine threonine-kinase 19 [Micractinium conductrix]|eukprot:PSC67391.1 Serine threonine-kinase 19 [Micractinium conductrix]